MEVRSGYKHTAVGEIPDDWDVAPLGELGEALIGLTYKPSAVREHGTLVLRSSNIQNDALAFDDNVFVDAVIPERIRVQPGDVLVCVRNGSRGLIGKSALLDERTVGMTFGAFMAVYRSPIGPLINYLFQSDVLKRQIAEHLGATINQITNTSLRAFLVPISSKADERQAITGALNDIDALLAALEQLIAKKRSVKQGAMQQLLTGQTRLPGFRGDWELKRLGDHVRFLRRGVNARAELLADGRVRYLHYGDVHACRDVYLSPGSLPSLPDAKAASLDRLQDGDLILVDASEDVVGVSKSVELTGVGSTDVVAGQHTIAARFDKDVLADGFKGYLQFCPPFAKHLRRLAAGTKVYATNRTHVASVEMPLPAVSEQAAIAAVLWDMDAEIAALEARRDKTRDLKQAIMQELLTGKTRLV